MGLAVNRNRILGLDVLKAVMILFVVFTHSAYAKSLDNRLLFNSVVDMAVPCFLIISGYVNAKDIDIKDYYQNKCLKRIREIIIPFLVVVLIDLLCWIFIEHLCLKDIVRLSVLGRWGDGGFYPYILIQFVLLLPIIVLLAKKKTGIICIALVNIAFETFAYLGYIPESVHRICIFRYLIFIISGIILKKKQAIVSTKIIAVMIVIGLACIYIINYSGLRIPIAYWKSTSYIITCWPLCWVWIGLHIRNESIESNGFINCVSNFGQATFFVMLFQMLYYYMIRVSLIPKEPIWLISIVVCCVCGYLWYVAHGLLMKKVRHLKKENS